MLRNGDLLYNLQTDSHEDLIALHNLHDTMPGKFARVEFRPDEPTDMDKSDKYQLRIDEAIEPDWFTTARQEKVATKLRTVVKGMIVSGKATCLIGGAYILAPDAEIAFIKSTRIVVMLDSSNVGVMWDSSNVGEMRESSNVGVMWDSSNVGEMRESSNVGVMLGSSKAQTDNRTK